MKEPLIDQLDTILAELRGLEGTIGYARDLGSFMGKNMAEIRRALQMLADYESTVTDRSSST